ncbi:MAG: hypothetical protein L6V95_14200 [Candidatus Melainabacteria bacterium]|nr:MAG: hypothetical protein L6V95_14200 [Candidatus Melainabacteria bacterium]
MKIKKKISEKIIKAAIVGTYLHGKAAEAATTDMSPHSVLQEDIINSIGGQIKSYYNYCKNILIVLI